MQTPTILLRAKLSSVSHADPNGTRIDLVLDRTWTLGVNDLKTEVQLVLESPASADNSKARVKKELSLPQVERILDGATSVVRLVQQRGATQQGTTSNDVEIETKISNDLRIVAIEHASTPASFALRAQTNGDTIEYFMPQLSDFDRIRQFLLDAMNYSS